MRVLNALEKVNSKLNQINVDIANKFLDNSFTDEDADYLKSAIQSNINQLKHMIDIVESGKRLYQNSPKVSKKKTPEYLIKRIKDGIEDQGCVTSEDFEIFKREFRSIFKAELKKVGAENLELSKKTHYFISGFFTYKEQAYYISLSDVRYFKDDYILIRTAKDYKDYTGGMNDYLKLKTDMFKNYFNV